MFQIYLFPINVDTEWASEPKQQQQQTITSFRNRPRSSQCDAPIVIWKSSSPLAKCALRACLWQRTLYVKPAAESPTAITSIRMQREPQCVESKQQKYDANSSFIHCFRFYIDTNIIIKSYSTYGPTHTSARSLFNRYLCIMPLSKLKLKPNCRPRRLASTTLTHAHHGTHTLASRMHERNA